MIFSLYIINWLKTHLLVQKNVLTIHVCLKHKYLKQNKNFMTFVGRYKKPHALHTAEKTLGMELALL